jgi:hypothetical protein
MIMKTIVPEPRENRDCAGRYGVWHGRFSRRCQAAVMANSSRDALQSKTLGWSHSEAALSPWQVGQQTLLEGISYPFTVSWFWLKRAEGKQELCFVVATYPYSRVYLVRLGRKRWAIEGFFKTIKHRFGLHCFGQSTKLGVYRWLMLSLIAYLIVHWINPWSLPPILDWKAASDLALSVLFPSVLWFQLLKLISTRSEIAASYGFEIILKPLPDWAYWLGCKI